MSESEEYNGWTNRETWAVGLHWDQTKEMHDFILDGARDAILEAKRISTHEDLSRATVLLSDWLEEQGEAVSNAVHDTDNLGDCDADAKMMDADVGSWWRVNWMELAAAYIKEVSQ